MGIHPSPVDSPHKGQWRGALVEQAIETPVKAQNLSAFKNSGQDHDDTTIDDNFSSTSEISEVTFNNIARSKWL